MKDTDIQALRNMAVSLLSALDEQTARTLVLTETLRETVPGFGPTFDDKYQEYKRRQSSQTSPPESDTIRLLDVLLSEVKGTK